MPTYRGDKNLQLDGPVVARAYPSDPGGFAIDVSDEDAATLAGVFAEYGFTADDVAAEPEPVEAPVEPEAAPVEG